MANFPGLLFAYAVLLIGTQFVVYGGSLIDDTFSTISFDNNDEGFISTLRKIVLFPFNFVIGMVKLCTLSAVQGLPVLFQFLLGAPACVGLIWMSALLVARIAEGIGALIPFT